MGLFTLKEAFVGKTHELLLAEQYIAQLREKYMVKDNGYYELAKSLGNINMDPLLRKIEECLEKEFGFTNVYIMVSLTVAEAQCITFPVHYNVAKYKEISEAFKNKNTGIKFDPKDDLAVIVCITSSMLFFPAFSHAEVLAVLLHEIGHNFEVPLLNNTFIPSCFKVYGDVFIRYITVSENMVDTITGIVVTMLFGLSSNYMVEVSKKNTNKGIHYVIDGVFLAKDLIFNVLGKLSTGMVDFIWRDIIGLNPVFLQSWSLTQAINITIQRLCKLFKKEPLKLTYILSNKISEKTADRFAAYYGYGTELSTALMKLTDTNGSKYSKYMGGIDLQSAAREIPVLGHYIGFCNFMTTEVFGIMTDPHPTSMERGKDMLMTLKKDLKRSDISPKMRKQLSAEVAKMEATYLLYRDVSIEATRKTSPAGDIDYAQQMNAMLHKIKDGVLPTSFTDGTSTLMELIGIDDLIHNNMNKAIERTKKLLKETENYDEYDYVLNEDHYNNLPRDPKYTGYSSNNVLVETYNGDTFFSAREAIEAGKGKEYFISLVHGSNLTFDELYQYNREWDRIGAILEEEQQQQQVSGVAQGNQQQSTGQQQTSTTPEKKEEPISLEQRIKNELKKEPDFEKIRDKYEKQREELQDAVNKMNRASAEDKGKFAVIVQQLKQGLRYIKEYMVRFANKAREQFNNKPKGYYQTLSNMDSIDSLEKQKKELEDAKTKREKEQAAAKANSNNNTVQQSSTVTNHPSTPTAGTTKPDGTVTQGGGGE
jgi:hypothetical protein